MKKRILYLFLLTQIFLINPCFSMEGQPEEPDSDTDNPAEFFDPPEAFEAPQPTRVATGAQTEVATRDVGQQWGRPTVRRGRRVLIIDADKEVQAKVETTPRETQVSPREIRNAYPKGWLAWSMDTSLLPFSWLKSTLGHSKQFFTNLFQLRIETALRQGALSIIDLVVLLAYISAIDIALGGKLATSIEFPFGLIETALINGGTAVNFMWNMLRQTKKLACIKTVMSQNWHLAGSLQDAIEQCLES